MSGIVELPIVYVALPDGSEHARFNGPTAYDEAQAWMAAHPDAPEFNYDVSDDRCEACCETFSSEAREETDQGWACPNCGSVDN
jgi:hypothetical protein